jgi:hypothetical protein
LKELEEEEETKDQEEQENQDLHEHDDDEEDDDGSQGPLGCSALSLGPGPECDQIQLTKEVLKWFDRADSKFRKFFLRRIGQLAQGQRSRILQKHLTGCKTAIWETYLEQKSGQRILWTECETLRIHNTRKVIDRSILIWFVAKHDQVNRLMRRIDKAESRNSEKLTSAVTLFEEPKEEILQLDDSNRILADPLGDTPLKLHILQRNEIPKLSSSGWRPRLYLTAEELEVVDKEGTVLVLGRSGTGKTICITNRMVSLETKCVLFCEGNLLNLVAMRDSHYCRFAQ